MAAALAAADCQTLQTQAQGQAKTRGKMMDDDDCKSATTRGELAHLLFWLNGNAADSSQMSLMGLNQLKRNQREN